MADKLSIPLKFPFKSAAGVQISSLPITRLKRKDLSNAQSNAKDEAAMEDHLVAKMTGMTLEDLMDLDIADSKTLSGVFREMVGGGDLAAFLGRGTAPGAEDAAL
ncbi:phage tail assembly protein [Pseudomonas yamanorum]|nr:phage tail assembly protein [Pseudomonas yamanorum]